MTDLYSEWRDFYAEKVRSWMSLEELRAECGKLQTVDNPSPEVLLVHAMHALEELQTEVALERNLKADAIHACALANIRAERLAEALRIAEAALADIGDADREPGDDVAWCERRAAQALPMVRALLRDLGRRTSND